MPPPLYTHTLSHDTKIYIIMYRIMSHINDGTHPLSHETHTLSLTIHTHTLSAVPYMPAPLAPRRGGRGEGGNVAVYMRAVSALVL